VRHNYNHEWAGTQKIHSKSLVCWNCGEDIASEIGYYSQGSIKQSIYICHKCNAPNLFDATYGENAISAIPGKKIKRLPPEIEKVYTEARCCISVGAYTGAVMLFRKILMNLAVAEGAETGQSFLSYVNFLCENGSVHKKQTKQADNVRKMGNEANHEIENRTKEEANEILKFVEFLLLNNYEFADKEETNNT